MTRRSLVSLNIILLGAMTLSSANAQAQANMVCGLEMYPSPTGIPEAEPAPDPQPNPSGDPCLDGEMVFGPTRFERSEGQPELEMAGFTLVADANVCVTSVASAKGKSFLYLDGMRIAEPDYFDDGIDEQVHSLTAGSHGLGVRSVGKPGEYVEVEVRQLASTGGGGGDPGLPMPGEVQIDPDTGALDMVSADGSVRLQNVAADHPLLTPNGDGHHDTTVLQALTTPLVSLPGKDEGDVDYFVNWEFQVTDLFTCNTIDTGLSGSEQINSPTLVTITWDGADISGALLTPGNYAYTFDAGIVDEFGVSYGSSLSSPGFGLTIADPDLTATDYDESFENGITCYEDPDPYACMCPGVDGAPGTPDPNCGFSFVRDLLPGFPGSDYTQPSYYQYSNPLVNYYDPSEFLDLSFISKALNPHTGRYTVTVDLRDKTDAGIVSLVSKGNGFWENEAQLLLWVERMTGVQVDDTSDSLFNFDYVQIGTSTAVGLFGPSSSQFNHFFLDAITDDLGRITVGGRTTNVVGAFNDDLGAPAQYVVAGRRGDECTNSGNTDGTNNFWGKFCAYNTAVVIGETSDLGIYALRTTVFDLNFNSEETRQDLLCVFNDIFHCGIRTNVVLADKIEIETSYYVSTASGVEFSRTQIFLGQNATGISRSADRANGEDGVCSRVIAIRDGLAVRMDAADGTVPDTCIINGIF